MTRIRASCPECGEVDLFPQDVTLRVVRAADGVVTSGSCYRFNCPDCTGTVTKPADDRIAQLLTTGGVPIEELAEDTAEIDDRPSHPESPPGGPRLTRDDLLDLHELLEGETWFTQLLAAGR